MELQNKLNSLADKIGQMKDQIKTEEATKTAFVLPFINYLGYDIFDPTEVIPEYTADLGIKKGEKVDYAIFQGADPILIIECKNWKENLNLHNSQLLRYFHASKTRFALLTNGIEYKFYCDLEESNKMDEKPFLEVNLSNLKENTVLELAKFHKSNFDVDKIVNNASSLKYTKGIYKCLSDELNEPSLDFVKFFASKVYSSGRLTEKVLEDFKSLVQKASHQIVSDKVSDRLNKALDKESEQQTSDLEHDDHPREEESKIVTTDEELEGFQIVVAILRRLLPKERIAARDTQSYFGVLLDDNNRKPLCRLHFNAGTKYVGLFDENKVETRHVLGSIDEIYSFEKQLLRTVAFYENSLKDCA